MTPPGRWPLVGRAQEIAFLLQALDSHRGPSSPAPRGESIFDDLEASRYLGRAIVTDLAG